MAYIKTGVCFGGSNERNSARSLKYAFSLDSIETLCVERAEKRGEEAQKMNDAMERRDVDDARLLIEHCVSLFRQTLINVMVPR